MVLTLVEFCAKLVEFGSSESRWRVFSRRDVCNQGLVSEMELFLHSFGRHAVEF